MEILEGNQSTAEGLAVGVFINRQGKNNETSKYGDPRRGSNDGRSPSYIINRIRMSVCLFVCLSGRKLLLGKLKDIDESYITGRRIFRGPILSIFQIDPTTGSDAIVQKPDTGRKNGRKTAVF